MSGLFGAPCDGNLKNFMVFFYSSRWLFRYALVCVTFESHRIIVITFSVKRELNVFRNVRLPSFLTNRARLWLHNYMHSIKKKKCHMGPYKFISDWNLLVLYRLFHYQERLVQINSKKESKSLVFLAKTSLVSNQWNNITQHTLYVR